MLFVQKNIIFAVQLQTHNYMKEIWRTVEVNKDYEVSNLGNVRSNKKKESRLLKPFKQGSMVKDIVNKGFYLSVRLLNNGVQKDYSVHRLVAIAFIPNPKNLPFINHKNGIRNDNRVENLEWCDNSYNIWHSYNVLKNTNKKEKSIVQYTKQGVFVKEWCSANEVERTLGINCSSISKVCRKESTRKTAGGYIWRFKGDDDISLNYNKKSKVVQISKYGEKIRIFDSIIEAGILLGISSCNIGGVCQKRRRGFNYAGGYIWRYESDFKEQEFGYFSNKTFVQMTLNNIFVREFKGTHSLVDEGGFDLLKVIMCCRGQRNSTNGFKWCIKEEGLQTRESKKEKAVVQLDKNMNFIAQFESSTDAERKTKIHSSNIIECCKMGLNRSAGGYKWMYRIDYYKLV